MRLLQQLCDDVRKKNEFLYLSDSFTTSNAHEWLRLHPQHKELLENVTDEQRAKNSQYRKLIKHIRAKARRIYGIYQLSPKKREELLTQGKYEQLLSTHLSTKERIDHYPQLYELLASKADLTSIIDIGCGLNPLSVIFMQEAPSNYIAVELNDRETKFIQRCLAQLSIPAKTYAMDVPKEYEQLAKLPHSTTCFLFKALDIFEEQNWNMTYRLLPAIQANTIIASFTTVNIKQERLKHPRRNWFEKVLDRLEYSYECFELGNELFYVITK